MGRKNNSTERIGTISYNLYSSKMVVIEYNNANDILVNFEETIGSPIRTTWLVFCKGLVKNPYDKSVYDIGYLGEGKYNVSHKGKHTPHYLVWSSMIQRCYSKKRLENAPTYIGCSVVEEWHNFQNFAAWYDENYYEVEGEKMNLDKDILIKGNNVYSPETCIFVPQKINTLFTNRKLYRGSLPVGVYFSKENNSYISQCCNGNGKQIKLNSHNTPEEAFFTYKSFKENIIKQSAEEYKNKIPFKLYEAIMNYKVEITD
jgi:hypothetical protein